MTHPDHTDDLAQDLFARKIAAHLDAAQAQLPYVVTERLRAAREQALAQRKPAGTPLRAVAPASDTAQHIHIHANGTLSLGGGAGQGVWRPGPNRHHRQASRPLRPDPLRRRARPPVDQGRL